MQKKKIIPYPFECLSFYFLVHLVSVHLSAHLSFSDETMGVLLVLMGHVVGTAVSSSLCWLTRRKALHGRTGWPLAGIK